MALFNYLQKLEIAKFKNMIILEELGMGHISCQSCHHVSGLAESFLKLNSYAEQLDASYYEQAAVQLALAYAPPEYLPLVIGFNLGYEQLPLHLLITNYELSELGIDPHYFNVHITIDNAHNGHAQKSLSIISAMIMHSLKILPSI